MNGRRVPEVSRAPSMRPVATGRCAVFPTLRPSMITFTNMLVEEESSPQCAVNAYSVKAVA